MEIPSLEIRESGTVKEIVRGIVKTDGLPYCIYGQLVEFESGIKGVVFGFNPKEVLIIVLGDYQKIKIGDFVKSKKELVNVPVGDNFLGRVIDCLAEPIDGKGEINSCENYSIFKEAPGIMEREPLEDQLMTGIKILDLIIPIGKGQRELIIGDRKTGRSSIVLDIVLNQKGKDVICIYCIIGGTRSGFEKIIHRLIDKEAMDYSIIVAALASDSPAEQFIAPFTATSLGEYFMHKGRDVVVIFDDLTKHAWAYRQISLLLERLPGREAYPGDIFFIHSQLIERAGRLKGCGTMSFFPIVETLQGDITGYIPSNIVSMTDGQIYLNTNLFHEGFKPAIDLGLSASRIGAKVQPLVFRSLSEGLRLEYLQYKETMRLMKLRTKLSLQAQDIVKKGEVLEKILTQLNYNPVSFIEEVVLFYAFKKRILEVLAEHILDKFMKEFIYFLSDNYLSLIEEINSKKELTNGIKSKLDKAIIEYFHKIKGK